MVVDRKRLELINRSERGTVACVRTCGFEILWAGTRVAIKRLFRYRLALACAVVCINVTLLVSPAGAQGFFESLFGGSPRTPPKQEIAPRQRYSAPRVRAIAQPSRPPPPRSNAGSVVSQTSIIVLGDGMAEWLSYGLEDAFGDSPQVNIVRKQTLDSGLIRYDAKSNLDWSAVARDILLKEKADYVVMMIGLGDRHEIKEKTPLKAPISNIDGNVGKIDEPNSDSPKEAVPTTDSNSKDKPRGAMQFRSKEWARSYTKRIDDTIAALKNKGTPVLWVGLPPIRGTRSKSEILYLNDLYRTRADRAGIIYIDVWDGFADEDGDFVFDGPDYEGQTRRLRTADGVYFTKYGARKLAHYVERALQRYMTNRPTSASLPDALSATTSTKDGSAERPLMGPVLPLTRESTTSEELLGRKGDDLTGTALSQKVLLRGEAIVAPAGRADSFAWPPRDIGMVEHHLPPSNAATPPAPTIGEITLASKQQTIRSATEK